MTKRTPMQQLMMESFYARTKHMGPQMQAKILRVAANLARLKKARAATMQNATPSANPVPALPPLPASKMKQ